jgi:hypothetical protein
MSAAERLPGACGVERDSFFALVWRGPSALGVQRGAQGIEISRSEDDSVSGGDVDEIDVDSSLSDYAGQVGQHARAVLDIYYDDLAFAGNCEMRDPQAGGAL